VRKEAGLTVVPDSVHGAFLNGFTTGFLFLLIFGLLADVAETLIFIPLEIVGRGLAAKIAIYTFGVHIEGSVGVSFNLAAGIGHGYSSR
jgi:hypothetical protein